MDISSLVENQYFIGIVVLVILAVLYFFFNNKEGMANFSGNLKNLVPAVYETSPVSGEIVTKPANADDDCQDQGNGTDIIPTETSYVKGPNVVGEFFTPEPFTAGGMFD